MKETENYLDTGGACKELGISIATLYRLLKKRKKNGIPAHRLGGNWRFIKDELAEWLRDQL
jgi:excisionase family DNA binding protein